MNSRSNTDRVKESYKPVNQFRLSRRILPHMQNPGHTYFVTFRTCDIIMPKEVLAVVMDSCLYWNEKKCKIHACVVMPDHVHILMTPLEIPNRGYYSISAIIHSIKSYSAKVANRMMNGHGVFWQREYFDHMVRSESDLLEKWNYIRTNPVKNGLVEIVEEYQFLYEENRSGWNTGQRPMFPICVVRPFRTHNHCGRRVAKLRRVGER